MDSEMGAQPGASNGDVHLSFYATYSHSEHSRSEEDELPEKGKFRGGNWKPGAVACALAAWKGIFISTLHDLLVVELVLTS